MDDNMRKNIYTNIMLKAALVAKTKSDLYIDLLDAYCNDILFKRALKMTYAVICLIVNPALFKDYYQYLHVNSDPKWIEDMIASDVLSSIYRMVVETKEKMFSHNDKHVFKIKKIRFRLFENIISGLRSVYEPNIEFIRKLWRILLELYKDELGEEYVAYMESNYV